MSDSTTDPIDDLAEDFARRLRAGERPLIEDYVARHPDQSGELRDVLEAVALMERLKPQPDDVLAPRPPHRIPERVGEFRIVREIGRGGMGVVYEAEQEALGRRVAVKVLSGHLVADDKSRERFRREAQAAARLHHTNIVPVFGSGESDGLCYYVMQLIDDRGLHRAGGAKTDPDGRAHRSTDVARGATRPPCQALLPVADLPPRDRFRLIARIGAQVADALDYAHSQGVLHRDIKPSNLLLDGRGTVWVTDFGVAKLADEIGLTQSGDFVGTLRYVPPERFAGHSDVLGDVYSLGVTLYELLAQRSAFPDTLPQHLILLITTTSPPPLRQHDPAIPVDLETIVHKAAARDPAQRYASAAELADDLRRFLEDRPIHARRSPAVARAWRWCRRKPALAGSLATAVLLLIGITIVSVTAYATTASANRQAVQALKSERDQREQAEQTAAVSLGALNRMYDLFAPTRLVVAPRKDEDGIDLPIQPALPPEAVPLLEELSRAYEQIARSAGAYPRLRAQAAEANHRIGEIRHRLGRLEEAASAFRVAIELYEQLPVEDDESVRIKRARGYNELGRTLRALRKLDETEQLHSRAIEVLGGSSRQFASRPECRYELARSYHALGMRDLLDAPGPRRQPDHDHASRGRPRAEGPEEPAHKATALLEELAREYPTVPEYRHLLACCYRDLPGRRGRGPESHAGASQAVALLKGLAQEFPQVPDYRLDLCETLARLHPPGRKGNHGDRDRVSLKDAIALSAELVKQYPNMPDYAAAHARYLDLLGVSSFEAGNAGEAEDLHRRAITFQTRLVKQYPDVAAYGFWLSLMERSLSRALSQRGEWQAARSRLQSAIARLMRLAEKDGRLIGARPLLATFHRELAVVLDRCDESARAAEARKKADEYGPEMKKGHPHRIGEGPKRKRGK